MIRSIRALPALLLLAALAACATTSSAIDSSSHRVEVVADPPLTNTQVITGFAFAVKESIAMSAPGNTVGFMFEVVSADCLRGSMNDRMVEFCRAAPEPEDKRGMERWRASTAQGTFTTLLSSDARTLEVESGRARAVFALGEGPGVEALRRSPALLGLAFEFGFVPAARGEADQERRDYKFKVAETR